MDKEKIYQRYVSVLNLCQQGVDGEKENALRMKTKMERTNPWLIMYHQERTRPQPQPNGRGGFDWGSVFTAADQIFSTIKDFSDAAYGMQRARLLADQCIVHHSDVGGNLQLTITVPSQVRHLLKTVTTEVQKDAFMETLTDRVYNAMLEDIYDN